MESEGINLDTQFLKELSKTLFSDIKILEKNIFEEAGESFNLASPKQLGVVLFDKLKLVEKPKKQKPDNIQPLKISFLFWLNPPYCRENYGMEVTSKITNHLCFSTS